MRAVRAVVRGLSYGTLLLVLLVTALTIAVPHLAGAVPLTVLSNSMAPAMPVGSLAVVRPTMPLSVSAHELETLSPGQIREVNDTSHVGVGDVILFAPNPNDATLVMHRVCEVRSYASSTGEDRSVFVTQGDNNSMLDAPVHDYQVRARVWYSLPVLGHVNDALNAGEHSAKAIVAVAVAGYGAALAYLVRYVRASSTADAGASA
ncbi:hypothetical protein [Xylanimonas ulmi]|uniref:Signal peptidase n=1 Tax=Xylanimonas ulmi TaxID=228973 RepID=A0A4Q7M1R7_9MICO|nr:hypothetical protein [Xylanibacterium ulmi]RZS60747.1 signal peptidase [Xylanibacterium ulmi]